MSIIRSFTFRRGPSEEHSNIHVGRAASQRAGKAVNRVQISSPVALVSSTNALSFKAPNIAGTRPIQYRAVSAESTDSSAHSADDSDDSFHSLTSNTDASSVEDNSPLTPEAEPNHLSCYFKPAVDTKSGHSSPIQSTRTSWDAPAIPRRVPSHSKKAHENLHRKRSVQRMISPPASIIRRTSFEKLQSIDSTRDNPFELTQLDEMAEDLCPTPREPSEDSEALYMQTKGLARFEASDYLSEIYNLLYDVYLAEEPSWI